MPYEPAAVSQSPTREPYETRPCTVWPEPYLCCCHLPPLALFAMDLHYPQPDPYRHWVIGVIVIVSAIAVMLICLFAICYRPQRTPGPGQIESASNRHCKNVIQQSYIHNCNGMTIMIQRSLMSRLRIRQENLQRTHQVSTL